MNKENNQISQLRNFME